MDKVYSCKILLICNVSLLVSGAIWQKRSIPVYENVCGETQTPLSTVQQIHKL